MNINVKYAYLISIIKFYIIIPKENMPFFYILGLINVALIVAIVAYFMNEYHKKQKLDLKS